MKKKLLFLLIAWVVNTSYAQEWIRVFEDPYNSFIPYDVIESYDKGYLILGYLGDGEYTWIIKTDINGFALWDQKFGNGQYAIVPFNVEQTKDNGLVFGGSTRKYDNQWDAYIIKLNSCGLLDWCSVIHTPDLIHDGGIEVKPTLDAGFVLLGLYNDINPNIRIHLFKFDSTGTLLWHQYYMPDSLLFSEDGMGLLVDSTGFLITGYGYYPDPGQSGGWARPYFIHTDYNGNEQWSLIYKEQGYYHGDGYETVLSSTGNYYTAGRHYRGNGDSPAMIKVNQDGSASYNSDLTPDCDLGTANIIDFIYDSVMIVGGTYLYYNETVVHCGLYKTDTLGLVSKYIDFPSPIMNAFGSDVTFDKKYICVSGCSGSPGKVYAQKFNSDLEYDSIYTLPFTYDSLCPGGIISDTVDPDCDLIVNVNEPLENPGTTRLKIFPNPATGKITIEPPKYLIINNISGPIPATTIFHQWKSTTMEIYDVFGNLILKREIKSEKTFEINLSGWSAGIYFIRLVYNGKLVASEKLLKR